MHSEKSTNTKHSCYACFKDTDRSNPTSCRTNIRFLVSHAPMVTRIVYLRGQGLLT